VKVLLVQLPVPENRTANLPLALGYLKAMAEAAHLPDLTVELLEAEVQNRGGDALIIDAILAHTPDLVGFSLYTWNSSRILGLVHALKRLAPEILVLGGGPEVNHDGAFVLASPDFDFLVLGEGEQTFVELLQALNGGKVSGVRYQVSGSGLDNIKGLASRPSSFGWHFGPPRPALSDVNLVPSAYLSGALEGHLGRSMSIELSRWCPSKCSFCYYGRQDLPRGGKRYFEVERVRQELLFGMAHGIEQVHFVEANFNTLPHLPHLYETIKTSGANRHMRFYAELRGEAIDLAEAQRLAECNFGTVEVGLQSAVPEVLAQVRRKNHLPRLVQGVHNLRALSIEVFLDVILGLPGETPDTFRRTLAFIEQNNLAPYDLFHLQILPGTQLRAEAQAGQQSIRWQTAPPYFVLETDQLSFETLGELRHEALQRKGDDLHVIAGLPRPGPFALAGERCQVSDVRYQASPVERVVLDLADENAAIYNLQSTIQNLARRLGSQVTIWLKLGRADEETLQRAEMALRGLSEPNPSSFWHIFVQAERLLDASEQARLYAAIFHIEAYLDRVAVFAGGARGWPSVNFFQLQPYNKTSQTTPTAETVWQVILAETETASQWQARLSAALADGGAGLWVITPPDCPPAKIRAALDGLTVGSQAIWLAAASLAAGLAYALAEDSLEIHSSLEYPLTACWQAGQWRYERPSTPSLERAALNWATAAVNH
jgi:radical SAM superfamily enzyme YgiQ (UPF0313 family)